jgi:DnaK suppressor protein
MDPDRARQLLAAERERIERALADLRGDPTGEELSHMDQHLADEGSELFEQERDAGLAARLREELASVERAEERLRNGSYGRSIVSGEAIPDARLEAHPTAERTVEEQARHERGSL